MSEHDPHGPTLCLHSVVVRAAFQRRGLATWMLRQYIKRISCAYPSVSRVLLLAHEDKLGLYSRCGFINRCESSVVHGADRWIEMER